MLRGWLRLRLRDRLPTMTSEPALTFTEKDRTELAMLADDYDAVPNAHDGRLIARAAAYIEQLESALAADGPAPAEEARAIEAHICLDCGTIYDHPTVCGLNGADSPTVPVRDAIQSREPAPAVREEARVEAAEQRLTLLKFEVPQ